MFYNFELPSCIILLYSFFGRLFLLLLLLLEHHQSIVFSDESGLMEVFSPEAVIFI